MAQKKTPANSDPFASAPTIESPKPKGRGKVRAEIDLGGKLDKLAAFKVLEKLLEGEQEMLRGQVVEQVATVMAQEASDTGQKPESFDGIGTRAVASCQIAKKAVTSRLSPEIADELRALNIPVGKKVSVEARLILNPSLDQETLAYLAKLVQSDPKLKDKTVVMKQAEDSYDTVDDKTIDGLAQQPLDTIKRLLPMVANFSVGKFRFDGKAIEAEKGSGEIVTTEAKAQSIAILQEMGVLPTAEVVEYTKKKRA